ncbi:hypothetical protein [Peribacillus simplex]|uniref:hypothetical protein n=1 Tax=Peribacillus simplex TaxID=1478 RepID=UPI003D27F3D8
MQPFRLQANSKKSEFACTFFWKTFQLISEIRSLSANCLPSRIKASVCGVWVIQLFGMDHSDPHFVYKLDGCIRVIPIQTPEIIELPILK